LYTVSHIDYIYHAITHGTFTINEQRILAHPQALERVECVTI